MYTNSGIAIMHSLCSDSRFLCLTYNLHHFQCEEYCRKMTVEQLILPSQVYTKCIFVCFLNNTLPHSVMTRYLWQPKGKVWYNDTILGEEVIRIDTKQKSPFLEILSKLFLIPLKNVLNPKRKSVTESDKTRLRYVFCRS